MAVRYEAGASLPQLAREFGGSHPAVRKALLRHGVQMRGVGRAAWRDFTAGQQAEIIRRWRDGESQSRIANSFGTTQVIISRFLVRNGIEPVSRPYNLRGAQNPNWKGGVAIFSGYRGVKVHPDDPFANMALTQGYVLEHRLVMARAIGRPLRSDETVHHVNGDKLDNRLENLQLRNGNHGRGTRTVCLDCGSHNIEHVPLS
jgi:hypothetical protein